jgi:hypothetical protein
MLRQTFLSRMCHSLTALLTIAAWFCVSNHCALVFSSRAALSAPAEASDCPMHSAPAEKKPKANIPCCKDLRAIASHAAKNINALVRQVVGAQDYAAAILVAPPRLTICSPALDTGPPHLRTFAESILQRSLLAHAPPADLPRV